MTIDASVDVGSAGRLVVRSTGERLVRTVRQRLDTAGATRVTLRPTARGKEMLRKRGELRVEQQLRRAHHLAQAVLQPLGLLAVWAAFFVVGLRLLAPLGARRYEFLCGATLLCQTPEMREHLCGDLSGRGLTKRRVLAAVARLVGRRDPPARPAAGAPGASGTSRCRPGRRAARRSAAG